MPAAGKLKDIVTAKRRDSTKDQTGHAVETYSDVFVNEPAEILPLKGKDFLATLGQNADQIFKIRLRYSTLAAGLTVNDRLINARNSDVYKIMYPANTDSGNKEMVFHVEKLARI